MFLFCLNCYTVNASIEVEVKFKKKNGEKEGGREKGGVAVVGVGERERTG